MKVSFAVAVLIGLVQAEEPVWTLASVLNHRTDSTIQQAYADHSTEKANSRPPYQSAVQLDNENKNEPVWKLTSVLGHREDSGVQMGYGDYSTEKANARPPYQSTIQLDNEHRNEPVWGLTSVKGHEEDSKVQMGYAAYSTEKANGRPPYQSTVQMEESDSESDSESDDETHVGLAAEGAKPTPPYNAWDSIPDGAVEGKYERVITPNFSADSDDLFMRSMIKKYAQEARTDTETLDDGSTIGGEPTGSFWMSKKDMFRAAKEVLGTHKGLSGDALSSYLDTYFDKAWENFDVNGSGSVEVIKSPQFMRFLASDQTMSLGE